jgi:hypothetical protein
MKITIRILAILLLVSCQKKSDNKYEQLGKMSWLLGSWENKIPNGTLKETWIKENDSTFSAKSYFIKEEDTLHNETILLTQKNDVITYSAKILGENNDKFVDFKLTSTNEKDCVFENPSHEYPQKIVYKKINSTNLVATISGIQQGKQCIDSYPMKKN